MANHNTQTDSTEARRLAALKERVEIINETAAKAQGALDGVMLQLEREFACKTEADAAKLLKKLAQEETEAKDTFERAFAAFETQYAEFLDEE